MQPMAIIKMKKGFIIGHQSNRPSVISLLQRLDMLEITQTGEDLSGDEFLQPEEIPSEIEEVEARLSKMRYAIDFLEGFEEVKKSLIEQFASSKVYLEEKDFRAYLEQEEECQQLHEECRELDQQLSDLISRSKQLEEEREQLTHWSQLDLPLEELKGTARLKIFTGRLDKKEWDQYHQQLAEEMEAYHLEALPVEDSKEQLFLIIHLREEEELLSRINGEFEVTADELPTAGCTAAERVKEIDAELKKLQEQEKNLRREIKELVDKKELLLTHYDAALMKREQLQVLDSTASSNNLFVIEGWIRSDDEDSLKENLQEISEEIVYDSRPPLEEETPPITLKNHQAVAPFEVVTQLYGMPNNRDIDPTTAMAPFFFFFFGLCLTDAGYGIVLALLSILALQKIRMKGQAKKLFQLLFLGGISTFLLGVLTGGWFGDLLPFGDIWFDPSEQTMYFLIVSLIVGVIHVYAALIMQFYKNYIHDRVADALMDQGLWLVFLTGLLMKFVVPMALESGAVEMIGNIFAVLGAAGLLLTQGRDKKNIIARLGSGILSFYDIIQYGSDVLSYSRLLALGLATTVIATVINDIASMVTGVPFIGYLLFVLILVVGHLFNLVINLVSAYVHTSRLQYVEFFSKFMQAGGTPFAPFGIKTEYIDLELSGEDQGYRLKRDLSATEYQA